MKNLITKAANKVKDAITEAREEAEQFMMEEMMEKAIPQVKKLIPRVEKSAKEFISEHNCIIVIKMENSGDISASVLNRETIQINPKEGVSVQDIFVKEPNGDPMLYSMENMIDMISKGGIENLVKSRKEKK